LALVLSAGSARAQEQVSPDAETDEAIVAEADQWLTAASDDPAESLQVQQAEQREPACVQNPSDEPGPPCDCSEDVVLFGGVDDHPESEALGEGDPRAGPRALALRGGVSFGLFYSTFAALTVAYSREVWDIFELALVLRGELGPQYLGFAVTSRLGVFLQKGGPLEILITWAIGGAYGGARTHGLEDHVTTITALVVSPSLEVRFAKASSYELRIVPLSLTGYFDEGWGLTVDPSIGVAFRF